MAVAHRGRLARDPDLDRAAEAGPGVHRGRAGDRTAALSPRVCPLSFRSVVSSMRFLLWGAA